MNPKQPNLNISFCVADHCGNNCIQYTTDYLAWKKPGIGRSVFFMLIQGAVFFVVLFLVEARVFRRLLYALKKKHKQLITQVDACRKEETGEGKGQLQK